MKELLGDRRRSHALIARPFMLDVGARAFSHSLGRLRTHEADETDVIIVSAGSLVIGTADRTDRYWHISARLTNASFLLPD